MSVMTVLHRRLGVPNPRVEPMDLDQGFAEALRKDPPMGRPVSEFAPNPAREVERAIQTVEKFGALPLKEIDDKLEALRADMRETEALGQTIRNLIMEVRQDYLDRLEKSRKVAELTRTSFAKLAEQCADITDPSKPEAATTEEAPKEEPKSDDNAQPAVT